MNMAQRVQPQRLGYVALNVTDVDSTAEFFMHTVNLEASEVTDGKIYLRGGWDPLTRGKRVSDDRPTAEMTGDGDERYIRATQHHWIVLQHGSRPGLARVGIEMATLGDLEAAEKRLRDSGVQVETGDGFDTDRIARYVRFSDPSGNPIELYWDMICLGMPPRPRRVNLEDILHVVLYQRDIQEAHAFYTDILGLELSDWIERRIAYLRFANGYHHGLGIMTGGRVTSGLDHICFLLPDFQQLMRARAAVQLQKWPFRGADLAKEAPSNSVGFYFMNDAENIAIEFCVDPARMSSDGHHKPRIFVDKPETLNVWQDGLRPAQEIVGKGLLRTRR